MSSSGGGCGTLDKANRCAMFEHQEYALLNQDTPGSGVQYSVLAATPRVRIISAIVVCTWTVQPTPLELHITIDGQVITHPFTNPVSLSNYYAYPRPTLAPGAQTLFGAVTESRRAFLMEGHNIAIAAEITGGTVQNLSARIKWAILNRA